MALDISKVAIDAEAFEFGCKLGKDLIPDALLDLEALIAPKPDVFDSDDFDPDATEANAHDFDASGSDAFGTNVDVPTP